MEREFSDERVARHSLGLVSVSGSCRSVGRREYALAVVRFGEPAAFGDRTLFVHDDPDQNAKDALRVHHARAALLHVRRHVLGRLSKNLFSRSEAWIFEWCAVTRRSSEWDERSDQSGRA